jgi:hypothetical protein
MTGSANTQSEARAVPPIAGRPANFDGAIGSYQVETRARPRQLHAEDPLIFTIRITGNGPLEEIRRPDLLRRASFATRFQIEELADRYLPRERAREFDYRLRPRDAGVKQIPPFAFVFFKPGMVPEEKGYQTTFAPAIPLTVEPRDAVTAQDVQGGPVPLDPPDSVVQLVEDPKVLLRRRAGPYGLTMVQGIAMLTSPPLLCGLWYLVWRRRQRNAGPGAHKRLSRVARQAIGRLGSLNGRDCAAQAIRAQVIFQEYLQRRTGLSVAEPTPGESGQHLERLGLMPESAEEVARFLKACDAARFAPGLPEDQDWRATATSLVRRLESEL